MTIEAAANFNYKNCAIQGAIVALTIGIVTIAIIFIRTKPEK